MGQPATALLSGRRGSNFERSKALQPGKKKDLFLESPEVFTADVAKFVLRVVVVSLMVIFLVQLCVELL